jgi:hypothetical protein
MTATPGGADVDRDAELGEILGDIDVRDVAAKCRISRDDTLELLIGDGDSAIVITTSWTTNLTGSAERVEALAQELLHYATIMRERDERRHRPRPVNDPPGTWQTLDPVSTTS